MKRMILNMAMVVASLLVGCAADTPTQVPQNDGDVVAKLVAGAVGFESNGLAATINDLVVAGTGGTLRTSVGGSSSTSVVVTRNDSTFDPSTHTQLLTLGCERNRADTYSEWGLNYRIRFADAGSGVAPLPIDPREAETYTDGTFRNASLKVQGVSNGRVSFEKVEKGREVMLSGDYRWDGTAVLRGGSEERYDDVRITFNWTRLYAIAGPGGDGQYLNGRCEVSIEANGPNGIISRSGALTFSGGDVGTLTIGGKRYLVSIRGAEVIRKG